MNNIRILIISVWVVGAVLGFTGCSEDIWNPTDPDANQSVTPEEPEEPEEPDEPVLPANAFLHDPLQGETLGAINDGDLTADGVQLHGIHGFINYSIPTTPNGYIEFSAKGFEHDELHGGTEYKAVLLTMWSGTDGYSYESAPFIYEMRKYGYIKDRPDASNALFFKIKSGGAWDVSHYSPTDWNPATTYRFRVEWGGGQTRVFRDGHLVTTGEYHGEFAPSDHQIQIGANPLRGRTSPQNLLISEVVIGTL